MSLHDKGTEVIDREFRQLLTQHSKAVAPILIMDLLGLDEELPHEDLGIDVHLPSTVQLNLFSPVVTKKKTHKV